MKNAILQINPIEGKENLSVRINFEGELAIQNMEEIKNKILPIIQKYNEFEIDIRKVENIDLTFMQFLCSFQKTILMQDKKANYSIEIPQELSSLLERSGYTKFVEFLTSNTILCS
jgi:anti-anti-sigma regulatory factor